MTERHYDHFEITGDNYPQAQIGNKTFNVSKDCAALLCMMDITNRYIDNGLDNICKILEGNKHGKD